MKKLLRFLFAFSVLLTFILPLCACSKRQIVSVQIKTSSFKTSYTVDENLDLAGAYLTLIYSSGQSDEIPISADMVTGFDTVTTGNKLLVVKYKEFKSDPMTYRVYNPENASREITTNARFLLFTDSGNGFTEYTVKLAKGDLGNITAAEFTFSSSVSLGISEDLSNCSYVSDSTNALFAQKLSTDGTKLKIVVYHTEKSHVFADNSVIIKLRIEKGTNKSVTLNNITVSDGEQDYYLPAVD